MIYTITFNPAIDYVIHMDNPILGTINRSNYEEIYYGGKGINVSIVLKELGFESCALGFIGGFTGKAIEDGVSRQGIQTDFIHLQNELSRINVKIRSDVETEINGQGPTISSDSMNCLFNKLDAIQSNDILILAGSIPSNLSTSTYKNIIERVNSKGVRIVVDATKDLLLSTLNYNPFLIKPNSSELGDLFGVNITSIEEVYKYARKLKDMGAVNVLVSMADMGAVLIDEYGTAHICNALKGIVKNSVGAGDSMVAGFIAGSIIGNYEYALKLGVACGSATAFSDGLAKRETIFKLFELL